VKKEKKEKLAGIFLIVSFLIIGVAVVISEMNRSELRKKGKYTIGTTEKIFLVLKSGRKVEYKFNVQDEVYTSSSGYREGVVVPNGRYYVKFLPADPEINEIFFDKPVLGHIKKAPPEGWSRIPKD
jgi:hypothetical protein